MNLPFAQVVVVEIPNIGFCVESATVQGLGAVTAPSLKEFKVAAGKIIFENPDIIAVTLSGPRGGKKGTIFRSSDPRYA